MSRRKRAPRPADCPEKAAASEDGERGGGETGERARPGHRSACPILSQRMCRESGSREKYTSVGQPSMLSVATKPM